MNHSQAMPERAKLAAVPTHTPDIELELGRMSDAVSRCQHLFGELSSRLVSVRADEPPSVEPNTKEVEARTPLGQSIRASTDRLNAIANGLEYQLRTLQLPV